MDPTVLPAAGIVVLIVLGFVIVLFILWCLLPFLIMGTNRRLDTLARQNERILDLLEKKPPIT